MKSMSVGFVLVLAVGVLLMMTLVVRPPETSGGVDYRVNSTADDDDTVCGMLPIADCTLREAINHANQASANIIFEIPGCPPACTITLTSDLPIINAEGITINGETQPGWVDQPVIAVDGNDVAGSGLVLEAPSVTIRGLSLSNFTTNGIREQTDNGLEDALIENNVIRDYGQYGILLQAIESTIANNVVDGEGTATEDGISLAVGSGSQDVTIIGNTVMGNGRVGIGAAGTGIEILDNTTTGNGSDGISTAFGGGVDGALIQGNTSTGNMEHGIRAVGDSAMMMDNIVSGNGLTGIQADDDGAIISGNTVTANGTAAARSRIQGQGDGFDDDGIGAGEGATVVGNVVTDNPGDGIVVNQSATIGGLSDGAANVISGNGGAGVLIPENAGPQAAGDGGAITDVTVSGNSIQNNGGLGIDLGLPGVTANDEGDDDQGANRRQNFPVLESAVAGSLMVTGSLNSRPEAGFRIEFFVNEECDSSSHGEGEVFVGSVDVPTDVEGNAEFELESAADVDEGSFVTATATNLGTRDTSEFSACVEVTDEVTSTPTPQPTTSPTPTATASPDPTATPTGTPTQTATPTPGTGAGQGDVDCDDDVDSVDALKVLRHVAGLPVSQTEPCDDIGTSLARVGLKSDPPSVGGAGELTRVGDVDCDRDIDSVDALKVLRHVASLPVAQTEPCQDIGA